VGLHTANIRSKKAGRKNEGISSKKTMISCLTRELLRQIVRSTYVGRVSQLHHAALAIAKGPTPARIANLDLNGTKATSGGAFKTDSGRA